MITNNLELFLQKNKQYFSQLLLILILVAFTDCKTKIVQNTPTPPIPKLVLIEFANTSGWVGNTVIIRGVNFGDEIAKNTVKFGNITARVIDLKGVVLNGSDIYELTVVVPENARTSKISVTVNGITETFPTDFVINSETVYAAGLEQNTRTDFAIAKYFKNGNFIKNFSDGTKEITIKKMIVVGSDIYILGKEEDTNTKYWKNGIPVRFGNKEDVVNDIFVNGVDVYLVGDENTTLNNGIWLLRRAYWKNGVINDVCSELGVRADGGANAIFVVGNDIYIAVGGYDYRGGGNPTPIQYFKNGIGVNFDSAFNQNTAIFVSNNNVYWAGAESTNNQNYIGKYWLNGIKTTISDGSFYPTAITAIGNDVYVTVTSTVNNNVPSRYYKNNVPFLLENSTDISYQQSIIVLNNDVYVTANNQVGASYWKNGKKMPYLVATTLIARDQITLNAMVVTQ